MNEKSCWVGSRQAIKREIYPKVRVEDADTTVMTSDYHNGWLVGSQRTQKSLVLCYAWGGRVYVWLELAGGEPRPAQIIEPFSLLPSTNLSGVV